MQIRPSVCGNNAKCRVDKSVQNLGYRCLCNEGYRHATSANNSSNHVESSPDDCVDVDECSIENGGCQHYCENSEGSFR